MITAYRFVVLSWTSEPFAVIDHRSRFVYRDTDEATARAVCDDLNRLSWDKK